MDGSHQFMNIIEKTNKPLAPLHEQDVSGFSVFMYCSIVSSLRILEPSNGMVKGPVFRRGVLVLKSTTVEGSGFLGQLQNYVSFIALTAHRIHLWYIYLLISRLKTFLGVRILKVPKTNSLPFKNLVLGPKNGSKTQDTFFLLFKTGCSPFSRRQIQDGFLREDRWGSYECSLCTVRLKTDP